MDNEEEEKQNYLRENILDKGYEAEDFVSFLISKKGDEGVDLGNWSVNELKIVVQEYIIAHPRIDNSQIQTNTQMPQQNIYPIQTQNQIPIQNSNYNINNINIGNNLINNNINNNLNNNDIYQNNNNTNYTVYNQENGIYNEPNESTDIYGITNLESISCRVNDKSEMSKYENIQIEMLLGEKVTGSFFSKAYMTFIITTSPLNFKVRRRYSDFEWLRQVLQNIYSSSVIPPIPKKGKIRVDRFEELFLLKRKRNLEKFLNSLLDDPVIRVSQILYDFLSIEEESLFNSKKKIYNSYKLPTNLQDFKSPEGNLDILINEDKELFYKNIKDSVDINQELLTKFNKNLKQLNTEMTSVFNRMDEISNICEELFLNSIKYYDINEIKITFIQLKDMFRTWSMTLKKQSCVFNVNIREYFKYMRNTFRSMKEMFNNVDNYKQSYYKSKRNLITKKEELFKKNDVSKWDLGPNKNISIVTLLKDKTLALPKMLYNETNAVINMKQMYGYYLNRAISEFERIIQLNIKEYTKNINENAKMGITIISELLKNISDIAVCGPKYDIKNIEKEICIYYNHNGNDFQKS